jgi:hypothetical protein
MHFHEVRELEGLILKLFNFLKYLRNKIYASL